MGATPMRPELPRVQMQGIRKHFGDVVALNNVNFEAERGEIHALLGENGAGKTTLMNILSGLYRPDAGEIRIDGREASICEPKDAIDFRVGMVHQHVELIGHFTVLENILLGREGSRWVLNLETQTEQVTAIATRYGLSIPLGERVQFLPVGIQQKIEIIKALFRGADTLILDEPTTMLTPQEVDGLFETLRGMADQGLTVIFITHKIKEALANCDRITVFRGGERVGTIARTEADYETLVRMMVGERGIPPEELRPEGVQAVQGTPSLSVRDLSVKSKDEISLLEDISFEIPGGSILGLAGVSGNGQRELAEALGGLRPIHSGEIKLKGEDLTQLSVAQRIAHGLTLIPQDRIEEGILPALSLAENLVLGLHPYLSKHAGIFEQAKARDLARDAIEEYNILAPNEQVPAAHLSGGNIQKVIVARAMLLAHHMGNVVLIANNPSRGLDIKATAFVHSQLRELKARGGAVFLISENLDELCAMCDRIIVIFSGRILGSFDGPDYDVYRIGSLMAGQQAEVSP
jgi:simple sugar transport system ATP-binding protein